MPKFVKIPKTEDITKAVQRIKALRERDVVFDIPKDSILLSNSANLRLMRKTAEVLGKNLQFQIDDDLGKLLAIKAGAMLYGTTPEAIANLKPLRSVKSPVNKVGDIPIPKTLSRKAEEKPSIRTVPAPAKSASVSKVESSTEEKPMFAGFTPKMPQVQPSKAGIFSLLKKYAWSSASLATLAIVIVIIFVLSIGWLLLPQATITVYARSEPISRDVEITVDAAATIVDQARMIIPGEMVTKELSHTKNFQTTGTKVTGEKATGSIVIYNFTKNTLTLKATTTTLIANGKKFYFTKDVSGIRPTSKIGTPPDDEVDRTSLIAPIAIIAENPGDTYNLPANQKFEIVNQALGATTLVYAMNEAALSGGTAKTIKILSQADIDAAAKQMSDELSVLVEQDFSSAGGSRKVLPSGASTEILAQTANKEIGDETTDFDMTIIGRIMALTFNEDDIRKLISNQISMVMSEDKYLVPDAQDEITTQFRTFDLAGKKGVLSVHYETMAAYKFEAGNLKELLQGKTATEIKEILMARPEVDRVDVLFSPSFINKAPKYNGKVKINTVMSGT